MNQSFRSRLDRVRLGSLVVGSVALLFCLFGALTERRQFFVSYLFGRLFWLGLTLGCFSVTMIHHLTGGRWGYPVRRFLEAGFTVLPLMLALFIPIFFGLPDLYPWARPTDVLPEEAQKHNYMNAPAFVGRSLA